MSHVFLLDSATVPLDPIHPGQARLLLKMGKAAIYRRYPFTLILKQSVEQPAPAPLRLKIDPGAKTTGLALLDEATGTVVWAAELTHRGEAIKHALLKRRGVRRGRRSRQTRYRAPRFLNRRRQVGWLPPSLLSRVENILNWVKRISKVAPVTALAQELVRFDLQALEHPEITGVEYQHCTLFGTEIREYLLAKWHRTCAYCGASERPLQVEHIVPRVRGGTDRVSNLALACEPCNQRKGAQLIGDFLAGQPERLARVLAQAKASLTDAAAVNVTRWELFRRLKATGLPLETGSGGRTKYNRRVRGLPKTHWSDAACVGASTPEQLATDQVVPLLITATGRGHRKMCKTNKVGIVIAHRKRRKRYFGYQTGDMVRAVVPQGARQGTHIGRVAVKASGYFTIQTKGGIVPDVAHRYCHVQQRTDGYTYQFGVRLSPLPTNPKGAPVSSPASKAEVPTGGMIHGL